LREALSYPAAAGTFSDDAIRNALRPLSLPELESRLDDIEQWDPTPVGRRTPAPHRITRARYEGCETTVRYDAQS
jgi:hypothetical protein